MEKIVFESKHPDMVVIFWIAYRMVTVATPIESVSLSFEECMEALKRAKVEPHKSSRRSRTSR